VVDELLSNYQHVIESVQVVTGTKGAFEVRVDDDLIFSKKTMQRRHAQPGEILEIFRDIVGPDVPVYPRDE
jgi:selT/selW/selH-like putative selenoprotein